MPVRTIANGGGNWNTAGTWVENAVPTTSDDVVATATSGNLTLDNNACLCKSIDFTNYVGELIHTSNGALQVLNNCTFVSSMTYTPPLNVGEYSLNLIGTGTFTPAGKVFKTIYCQSGAVTLGGHLTFSADPGVALLLNGTNFNLNGYTITGDAVERVNIKSYSYPTVKKITVSGGTFAYANFMCITFDNGGSNLDLSAITGLSGDCLGNTMTGGGTLTFTSSTDQHWTNANGGSWKTASNWTSRVPLPQDNVIIDCVFNSNKTIDGSWLDNVATNVDFSGASWTGLPLRWQLAGARGSAAIYGSLTLVSGLVWNGNPVNFYGRGLHTIDMKGVICSNFNIGLYAVSGTYTLLSDLRPGVAPWLYSGTFAADIYTITVPLVYTLTGSTFDMGSGVLNLTSTTTVLSSTGTFICGTSTINITDTSASAKVVNAVAPYAFNNVVVSAGGSILFKNAMTVNNLSIAGPKAVTFQAGFTTTINGSFTPTGTANNLVTLNTDTDAGTFTLSDTSGTNTARYTSIKHSTATGGAKWYSRTTSGCIDGGGNNGWIFTGLVHPFPSFYAS